CGDGRRVVMGLLCPALVAFFFDEEGNLLGREERPWTADAAKLAGDEPPYSIFSSLFLALIDMQMQEWQAELEFRPCTIHVQEFFDVDYPVGIEILPDHYKDIETSPWIANEVERREFRHSRDGWLA